MGLRAKKSKTRYISTINVTLQMLRSQISFSDWHGSKGRDDDYLLVGPRFAKPMPDLGA